MANAPDDKHLPVTKKDVLRDDLAKKVSRTLTDAYRDLRKHEVSKGDAREIVVGGSGNGFDKYRTDTKDE